MKIYTRTGDRGETGLFGGQRVPKDHIRVAAYGDVDELNSLLGVVVAALEREHQPDLAREIRTVQADLLVVGANLATPGPEDGGRANAHIPTLDPERPGWMERYMDAADAELEPLRNFILPGGSEAGALLHLARTVCRRAERQTVALARHAHIADAVVVYLNRLSDLLFTWARLANHRAGKPETPWVTR